MRLQTIQPLYSLGGT